MKEILEYINSNDKLTVSKPLLHVTTVRWGINKMVSFYLHISEEEIGHYRCGGAIVTERNGTDKVELINVSKVLYDEKEVINLLEEMIETSVELLNFIQNKGDHLNN